MLAFPDYTDVTPLTETSQATVLRARQTSTGRGVVIKVLKLENPSPAQVARLKHAFELIRKADPDGVVRVLDMITEGDQLALVMEDFGGVPLKDHYKSALGPAPFLDIAIRLAGLVQSIHLKNVSHQNIKPANILYNAETDTLKLTDFSVVPDTLWSFKGAKSPKMAAENLAYISPEQTGRMNCGVDYRSDYYSLGVTFYELVTGGPPFSGRDPMELIHAHIAKKPVPPHQVNPHIPEAVSDIIMHLLAKSADGRYQSGQGLLADLEHCRDKWMESGRIGSFEPGLHDRSPTFNEPQVLVGREKELATLFEAFDLSAAGNNQVVMVKGEPGIGKSVLIHEIHKPIVGKRGYFIAGKYDQLRQSVPYSAIIQALHGLCRQLLAESDEHIEKYKERLLTALGPNGKIITDIIPDMEAIIGKQPDIPELEPEEAQNRFKRVLVNFLGIFAERTHPLVMFLDDLQWVDPASIALIQTLIMDQTLKSFLFIGAYRDKEVSTHHPLPLMLEDLKVKGLTPTVLALGPLSLASVNQLLADFLRCDGSLSQPLADVFQKKTLGNPFFVIQFLKRLFEGGHITLDLSKGWLWNAANIKAMQVTDNVVSFMAEKLITLSAEPFDMIKTCACIGNRFNAETLAAVSGTPLDRVLDSMGTLSRSGLISFSDELSRFHHDRIQEAAYSLIPIREKQTLHHRIGRLALEQATDETLMHQVFYIADQLNHAADIIESDQERIQLADINLKAGIKAKESTAYKAAVDYLQAGISLVPETAWNIHYALTYGLYTEQMECQYLARNFDEAERLFQIIIDKARGKIDKAKAYNTMIVLYTNTRSPEEAVALGLSAIHLFDKKLNAKMGPARVVPKLIQARLKLKKMSMDDILNLPLCTDEERTAYHMLLFNVGTAAYFTNPNLFAYLVLIGVTESLKYGLFPHGGITFITMASLLENLLGDYDLGYDMARMAMTLNQKLGNRKLSGMIHHIQAFFIQHWNRHAKYNLPLFKKVYQLCMDHGNFIYAGHSINASADCRLILGDPLDAILKEKLRFKGIIDQVNDPFIIGRYHENIALIRTLQGLTDDPSTLSGPDFDAEGHMASLREANNIYGLCFALYLKVKLNYLFGKYNEALVTASELDSHIKATMGTSIISEHYFYHSMILAALLEKKDTPTPKLLRRTIARNQRKLSKWAKLCPENFRHKHDLVQAELAAVDNNIGQALKSYHAAVEGARQNDYVNDEALSCERLACFYLKLKLEDEARVFMNRAWICYGDWGATAKQNEIRAIHKDLLAQGDALLQGRALPRDPSRTVSSQLDLAMVMEASHAISSEIVVDQLIQKIMRLSITNAGAQRGFLILDLDGELTIMAREETDQAEWQGELPMALKKSKDLAHAIIHYVSRTLRPLILPNASAEGLFTQDTYIQHHLCKSVLCMPILYKGRLSGVLYMENNLTANAFTDEQLDILNVIAAQAAISIENARLFEWATTDGLTRLIVHRYFQHLLDKEIDHANRYTRPFSLVMMDIDNFKHFNDTYGHQLGDEVLRQVAATIREHVRAVDIAARYGGEEFVLILPETEIQQALVVCEKIRALVETLPIPHGEQTLHVTLSLGVATFPHHAQDKEALIRSADAALFASKRSGKNRVSVGEKTGITPAVHSDSQAL